MDILVSLQTLLSQGWFWYVIVGSGLFAAGNFVDEEALKQFKLPVGVLVIVSGLFGQVLMLAFATLAFHVDGATLMLDTPDLFKSVGIGVLEMLWLIPYLYATERRGAMVAGPLFQAVPVVAFGLEAMLGTIPLAVQIGGALLIVIGGMLLSIEEEEDENGDTNHRIDWVTLGLMLLAVFLVAVIYVLFRDTAESTNYVGVGFWSGLGMTLTAGALYRFYRPYREVFDTFSRQRSLKAIGLMLFNECLDAGGVYLNHLANIMGPSVMVVSAFNAAQPIFIGLIGFVWFAIKVKRGKVSSAEKSSWKTWALIALSILLIATGTVLVALGE